MAGGLQVSLKVGQPPGRSVVGPACAVETRRTAAWTACRGSALVSFGQALHIMPGVPSGRSMHWRKDPGTGRVRPSPSGACGTRGRPPIPAQSGKALCVGAPLFAGQRNEIPLGRMTTNVGRFYLRGASATSNQVITATQPKVACYSEEGSGRLIVRSLGDVMTRCEVYSVGGNMSGMSMMETYEYSLPVSPGVAVVKVYFRDGISSVFKVFVNK